jgi:hypothetical protein
MKFLKIALKAFIFIFLTILTQVGGLIFLISLLFHRYFNSLGKNQSITFVFKSLTFLSIYSFFTFLIFPKIAKPFGRVPLPISEKSQLKPLNILTCFLNRNYVRPELRAATFEVAKQMNKKYPGITINYLDGNFPFLDKFPLIPHLSHNDGRKLDLSFCYIYSDTNLPSKTSPSFIGYGICEGPLPNEVNTAQFCTNKGYWQYSYLQTIIPQGNKSKFIFDAERTADLVKLFVNQANIGKIFIEPHLKTRLNLESNKIRFHGCQAVRHDDHIHVQLTK